ncbi:MAG: LamG domain-containing protein [Thermogutta sp.]
MARSFNGTNQFLRRVDGTGLALPLTMAAWVYPQRNTAYEEVLALARSTDNNTGWFVQLRGPDGMRVAAVTASQNTYAIARSTGSFSLNQWQHVAGVFTSSNARRVYLNGVPGTLDTTSVTVPSVDRMLIGAWEYLGGWSAYLSGAVAEAAIWRITLLDAEIAQLAAGYSPLLVRPNDLIAYWPLGGPFGSNDEDHSDHGYDLTAYGDPTWVDHPPITYPQEPQPPESVADFLGVTGMIFSPGGVLGHTFTAGAKRGHVFGQLAVGQIRIPH